MKGTRTVAGLVLVGGAGHWETPDGRFTISVQEGTTECDCTVVDVDGRCPKHWVPSQRGCGGDGMNWRVYRFWGVVDSAHDDWWRGDPTLEYDTLAEAAADLRAAEYDER